MYEWASQRLAEVGYAQYEISNWAAWRGGEPAVCRHNLQYWRGLPYLGFGAGAHGFAAGQRTANVLSPAAYIQRYFQEMERDVHRLAFPQSTATQTVARVDRQAEIAETMMMGLRLVEEGISDGAFQARFSLSLRQVFGPQIERLLRLGLLEWAGHDGQTLRLTQQGRLLGNQVFMEFI
jgi:oxygen-independent coproporphyrinogen-3 oxidase